VDDLLDEILKRLPEAGRPRRRTPLSLAILGRPNVGKSSFMNRVLGHERAIVTPTPGTTRDVVEETFEREGRHFRLLDTAGIRRKPRVKEAVEYYSVTRAIDQIARCDVALVMFDAFDGPNNQDKRIANLVIERHKGMVIIANKMDRVPPDLKDKVNEWMKQELEFCRWAPLVRASVINGVGIDAALAKAASVWDRGGQAVRNSELRAALMPRLVGNPPRHDTRVLALSQTGTRPPAFRLRLSNPKAMTPSYEKFLVAEIRKRFRFPGYPILLHVTR
jgi:GTP-binding protein